MTFKAQKQCKRGDRGWYKKKTLFLFVRLHPVSLQMIIMLTSFPLQPVSAKTTIQSGSAAELASLLLSSSNGPSVADQGLNKGGIAARYESSHLLRALPPLLTPTEVTGGQESPRRRALTDAVLKAKRFLKLVAFFCQIWSFAFQNHWVEVDRVKL